VGPHFLLFSFRADTLVEAFLVARHVAHQIQLQTGFGFPKPTPASLDSVSVSLLGHLSLLPYLACICFMVEFSQELLVRPCRPPAAFAGFPAHRNGPLSHLEVVIFENEAGELLEKKTHPQC